MVNQSILERAVKAKGVKAVVDCLSEKEKQSLTYAWKAWARPNQLPPPGDWLIWLLLSGRGFGKSRAGAEYIRSEVEAGRARRIALIGETPADVRDVMIEGQSGILACSSPWFMPVYEPSKRKLTWPNGAFALCFSSYEPGHLRGPQFDLAWGDEARNWHNSMETWDNLMLGLRLGDHPRVVITTTPSPITLIKHILVSPNVVITKGSTYENKANLPDSFFEQIISRYKGTRLGQQEIEGLLLEDMPGALWRRDMIKYQSAPAAMERVVVAIDPAVTSGAQSDETGIIAAGKLGDQYFILDDRSLRSTPDGWARVALFAYDQLRADKIIGEVNNGGEMVELTLRTINKNVSYKAVHASRGKAVRAEPISALYEQGKIFHVKPFVDLEDQMVIWTPESGKSPDRMDALVWALTELSHVNAEPEETIIDYSCLEEVESRLRI